MKKQLKIEATDIAKLLGTVGSPLIVISELIKNSIDAAAKNIDIEYNKDKSFITIVDDGNGFTLNDIDRLATPGVSNKKINGKLKNEYGNFYTGSKGLGLLSVFSLCDNLNIKTKNELNESFVINWPKIEGSYSYEKDKTPLKKGTTLTLSSVYPEVMSLLTSTSEIKKLMHISTYLFKHEELIIPNITLKINDEPPYSLLFKTDFLPTIFDVSFQFNSKGSKLNFKCVDRDNLIKNDEITIDSFDIDNIKKIMEDHYGITKFYNTRTNEVYDFIDFDKTKDIPSFEGRILVYENKTAGSQLKCYGAGVNFYINNFALYNYLSDGFDWLDLADFSQRRKFTRLKPHNVYGYINLPSFDETKEKLKISNERADFIQDETFVKLMYLIKGVIIFIILNIDVTEKNIKPKSRNLDAGDDQSNNEGKSDEDSVNDIDKENDEDSDEDSEQNCDINSTDDNEETNESKSNNSENQHDGNNSQQSSESEDSAEDENEPESNFKPSMSKTKILLFTEAEGDSITKLKGKDDLCNKICQVTFELSKLNILNFQYATVCLYRTLIESATQYMYHKMPSSTKYNEDDLHGSVINVLNYWGNGTKDKVSKELRSEIDLWRDLISKRGFIKKLNLYIHYGEPVDSDLIYNSWKSMKGYIYHCISS